MRIALTFMMCWLLSACGTRETACPDANCNNYGSQAAAQAAFDKDPACLKNLDADGDGIACEHLSNSAGGVGGVPGSGSSGCPTTSNCGCSNKNKADCGGPCCKWTVGSGCGCS